MRRRIGTAATSATREGEQDRSGCNEDRINKKTNKKTDPAATRIEQQEDQHGSNECWNKKKGPAATRVNAQEETTRLQRVWIAKQLTN